MAKYFEFEKNGKKYNFRLDSAKILELEAGGNDYDFLADLMGQVDKKSLRFSTIFLIAQVIGSDYDTLVYEDGFTVKDIMDCLSGCIELAGFRSDSQ